MPLTARGRKIADRLIWRPPMMGRSVAPASESVTTMRFRGLPSAAVPGDWLQNESPRARCAYRILEIGKVGSGGYRKLVLESHPVDQIPPGVTIWPFCREGR